jgi:hypothetical protein
MPNVATGSGPLGSTVADPSGATPMPRLCSTAAEVRLTDVCPRLSVQCHSPALSARFVVGLPNGSNTHVDLLCTWFADGVDYDPVQTRYRLEVS